MGRLAGFLFTKDKAPLAAKALTSIKASAAECIAGTLDGRARIATAIVNGGTQKAEKPVPFDPDQIETRRKPHTFQRGNSGSEGAVAPFY
jgi:hypothetical protein